MNLSSFMKYAKQATGVVQEAKRSQVPPDEACTIVVYVEEGCPSELVRWIRETLVPERNACTVKVESFDSENPVRIRAGANLALILVADESSASENLIISLAEDGIPCAVLAQSSVEAPNIESRIPADAQCALITATSREALIDKLSAWLASSSEMSAALAAAFPFVRGAKARQLISECAVENALIGALGSGSAAQMPLMTANQARMAFELASIFGLNDLRGQAPCVGAVVGAGFLWRTLARSVSKRMPGIEPIVRVAVAFGGTLGSGHALKEGIHFAQTKLEEQPTSTELAV